MQFHGVYAITVGHEALGTLWACLEFTDKNLGIRVQHLQESDEFRVTGTYVDFLETAGSLTDTGAALRKLRYVNLADFLLEALDDAVDSRAVTAQWN